MDYDISQPVPQRSNNAQDAENSRIATIANELKRLCAVHEAQSGVSQPNVSRFETEQRAAETIANMKCGISSLVMSWLTRKGTSL